MAFNGRLMDVSSVLSYFCLLLLLVYASCRNIKSRPQELKVKTELREKTLPVVLVTAYMHGGSSIVGSLLEKDPKTTYIYEPGLAMHSLRGLVRKSYQNGSVLPLTQKQTEEFEHYYLQKLFKCDFRNMPSNMCHLIRISADDTKLSHHKCSTRCIKNSQRDFTGFHGKRELKSCISQATITMNHYSQFCKKSDYIASKLLRYDMSYLIDLLKQHENIYLFHLVRNPHGIVNSFLSRYYSRNQTATALSQWICPKMEHNLNVLKSAGENISRRIKVLHYEDFVENPVRFTEELYKVISRGVPKEVQQWVLDVTNASHDNGKYEREDSKKTAYSWQRSLTEQEIRTINSECSTLLASFRDSRE